MYMQVVGDVVASNPLLLRMAAILCDEREGSPHFDKQGYLQYRKSTHNSRLKNDKRVLEIYPHAQPHVPVRPALS